MNGLISARSYFLNLRAYGILLGLASALSLSFFHSALASDQDYFSPEQISAIQNANLEKKGLSHNDDLKVRVFVREKNGKVQKLILVGEQHLMKGETLERGKKLLETSKTFGRETDSGFKLVILFPGIILDLLNPWGFSAGLKKFKERNPEDSLMILANELAAQRGDGNIYDLEKNHWMGLSEWLETISFSAFLAAPAVMTGSLLRYLYAHYYGIDTHAGKIGLLFLANYGITLSRIVLSAILDAKKVHSNHWARNFQFFQGLIGGRDKSMVNEIVRVMDEVNGPDEMTAVIGKAHISGMGRHLVKKGFRKVKFDEIQAEEPVFIPLAG